MAAPCITLAKFPGSSTAAKQSALQGGEGQQQQQQQQWLLPNSA